MKGFSSLCRKIDTNTVWFIQHFSSLSLSLSHFSLDFHSCIGMDFQCRDHKLAKVIFFPLSIRCLHDKWCDFKRCNNSRLTSKIVWLKIGVPWKLHSFRMTLKRTKYGAIHTHQYHHHRWENCSLRNCLCHRFVYVFFIFSIENFYSK